MVTFTEPFKIYTAPKSCVLVNNLKTNYMYFEVQCGVQQGDIISQTIFSLYINDLVNELNSLNLGVPIDDENVCALLYADDIVLFSDTEAKLQSLQNTIQKWCSQWRLKTNLNKTNIVHFRKQIQNRTEFQFKIGNNVIELKESYKYLGCILSETLDFIGIWGFKSYLNRYIRAYLGVHNKTSNLAIRGEVGWVEPDIRRKLGMIRLWARLISMDDNRLTKRVFLWDYNQQHG